MNGVVVKAGGVLRMARMAGVGVVSATQMRSGPTMNDAVLPQMDISDKGVSHVSVPIVGPPLVHKFDDR